jgi:hypothetical protein
VTKELCVLTVSLDKHAISWAERRRAKLKSQKAIIMATLQQSASGKKDGDIRSP